MSLGVYGCLINNIAKHWFKYFLLFWSPVRNTAKVFKTVFNKSLHLKLVQWSVILFQQMLFPSYRRNEWGGQVNT